MRQLRRDHAAIRAAIRAHSDTASAQNAAILALASQAGDWTALALGIHRTALTTGGQTLTHAWQQGGADVPNYDPANDDDANNWSDDGDADGWLSTQASGASDGVQSHTGRMLSAALIGAAMFGTGAMLSAVSGLYAQWTGQTGAGDYAGQLAGNWTRTGWAAGEQSAANVASASGLYGATKTWWTVGDDRVRPTHDDADGQEVDYDQPFRVGGEDLDYPCDPSGSASEIDGCRCSMVWMLADGTNADADLINALEAEDGD